MGIAAVPEYLRDSFKDAPPGHRCGLYFEVWKRETWEIEKDKKTDALRKVLELDKQSKKMLNGLQQRQRLNACSITEDRIFFLAAKSTSPFMTGIGMEHPLENGFAFMNPYGLPYLPGASVKGVLRKAAEELALGLYEDNKGWSILDVWWLFGFEAGSAYFIGEKGEKVEFLKERAEFLKANYLAWVEDIDPASTAPLVTPLIDQACENESERHQYRADQQSFIYHLAEKKELRERIHQRGALIFWDVFPEPGGDELSIDILTPHYGEYYEGKASPADCGQPVPNPFLAMPPDSAFEFYAQYAPVSGIQGYYNNRWKQLLEAAFAHAFDWLGFGAKTSVGYGQMSQDGNAQMRLNEEKALQAERKAAAAEEERRKHEEEQRKAELESMSPEERDIALIRAGELSEERVVEIYNRIDEFSTENRAKLAQALKEYWIAQGKWRKKDCSKKQWIKVQKVNGILGNT